MSTIQQRTRRQQHLEALCAATIRALCRDPRLRYRSHRLCIADTPVANHAPHLRVTRDDSLTAYRGAADGMALWLLYSDSVEHRQRAPDDAVAKLMFDWLEQLRVESLVPEHLPGLRNNIDKRFTAWSRAFVEGRYLEGEIGEIVYTVAQVCRYRLTGRPILEETEGLIETRRGMIVSEIGHALAGLRRERHNQKAFAEHALAIAAFLARQVAAVQYNAPEPANDDDDNVPLAMFLDFDSDANEKPIAAHAGESTAAVDTHQRYHAFTTAYDIEQPAAGLVRAEQLAQFRAQLDATLTKLHVNQRRLARFFQAHLSVAENSAWQFGKEEGYIDGRRLAQIVAAPTERRVFAIKSPEPRADTVVGLLLDCSGSMKAHAEFLALIVDRLAGTLAMAGIPCEITGFTTGAWSGGRARQDWIRAGKPDHPGRLNEVQHLIFKQAQTPWRRARRNVAALLKNDIYREGIDGEAVEWACNRLSARVESRRILTVISDGSPMDSATDLANTPHYLDSHLRHVVTEHTRQGNTEIRALGVGLDLSLFYDDSLIIDPQAQIDNGLLGEIAALIVAPKRNRHHQTVA